MKNTDEKKFYGMMNDYMFHLVLQESDKVLRGLVSALMDIPLEEIKSCCVENPIDYGKAIDDKEIILDVQLTLNDDTSIDIEVQVEWEKEWTSRSLLYWARTYDGLKTGEGYEKLIPTVHIGILNFPLFRDEPAFFSEYEIRDIKTEKRYSDKLSIKVLDLTNTALADDSPKEQKLLKWAGIFKAKTLPELEQLCDGEEVFREMAVTIKKLNADEELRLRLQAREDYKRRLRTQYNGGHKDGEHKMASLVSALASKGRMEDIKKAASEPEYRELLYNELGIE